DTGEAAQEKLGTTVRDLIADAAEAQWVESHLAPLAGLGVEVELGGDRRGEAFAAWRRFFEALAERRPLVLVFEDLQWADDELLDFVDALPERVSGVPRRAVRTYGRRGCTSRRAARDRAGDRRGAAGSALSRREDVA